MKWVGRLILAGLVLAAVSFVLAPTVAFFAIRSAADARDVAGLTRLVDYDDLRRALRPQLGGNPAAVAPAPSFLDDPVGAMRYRFQQRAPSVAPPNPDIYLTPAALSALTRGEGRAASARTGAVEGQRDPWPAPAYWGFDRARFSVKGEGGRRTLFTFERRGLYQWVLVHIGLPETAPAPVAR